MDQELLNLLRSVDTPTVCNAIEVVEGKRGFDRFTRGTMVASDPGAKAIVGYARTAKLAAARPSRDEPDVLAERRMAYYRYMAESSGPKVAVIQDLDWPDCIGAYWGEINTTVHKGLGVAGALTNGVVRDLGDLPEGFPVIAGSIGPSHAHVHLREIDCDVEVMGLAISPGELVHADRHGAAVIPQEAIPALADGIAKLIASERIVLDAARAPGFDFATFEQAWKRFEKARV